MSIQEYTGKSFRYHCGNEFLKISKPVKEYTIICVDSKSFSLSEVISGEMFFRFEKESYIPGKHKSGGQSAQRFERNREEALKQYYKKISKRILEVDGKVIISGPAIDHSRLWNYLDKENYKVISQGYTGYSGCLQTFKLL